MATYTKETHHPMILNKQHYLKTQILLIGIFLISSSPLHSQLLWPGDINNNGEVNIIDMLYYGIARDYEGPERDEDGTDWEGYEPSDPWDWTFGDGMNYCHADADGKGDVDNKDRDAILKDNYGFTHGTVTPDVFLTGNPNSDPTLLLVPRDSVVEPKKKAKIDVFLGDAVHPVNGIFGIAFRLHFDPELVADESENKLHNPNEVKFKLEGNTWLNASGGAKADDYIRLNNTGWADVVIMRRNAEDHGSASAFGEIGTFEIVMEDIVLYGDETETLHLWVSRIKMVDVDLNEFPVAPSSAEILVVEDDNDYHLVQQPDGETTEHSNLGYQDRAEMEEVIEERNEPEAGLKLYPNPVESRLWIEWHHETEIIEKVDLFNSMGQLLFSQEYNQYSIKARIDMSRYNKGSYWLRVTTAEGVSSSFRSKLPGYTDKLLNSQIALQYSHSAI